MGFFRPLEIEVEWRGTEEAVQSDLSESSELFAQSHQRMYMAS